MKTRLYQYSDDNCKTITEGIRSIYGTVTKHIPVVKMQQGYLVYGRYRMYAANKLWHIADTVGYLGMRFVSSRLALSYCVLHNFGDWNAARKLYQNVFVADYRSFDLQNVQRLLDETDDPEEVELLLIRKHEYTEQLSQANRAIDWCVQRASKIVSKNQLSNGK